MGLYDSSRADSLHSHFYASARGSRVAAPRLSRLGSPLWRGAAPPLPSGQRGTPGAEASGPTAVVGAGGREKGRERRHTRGRKEQIRGSQKERMARETVHRTLSFASLLQPARMSSFKTSVVD